MRRLHYEDAFKVHNFAMLNNIDVRRDYAEGPHMVALRGVLAHMDERTGDTKQRVTQDGADYTISRIDYKGPDDVVHASRVVTTIAAGNHTPVVYRAPDAKPKPLSVHCGRGALVLASPGVAPDPPEIYPLTHVTKELLLPSGLFSMLCAATDSEPLVVSSLYHSQLEDPVESPRDEVVELGQPLVMTRSGVAPVPPFLLRLTGEDIGTVLSIASAALPRPDQA